MPIPRLPARRAALAGRLLATLCLLAPPLQAGMVRLTLESAPAPSGPWTRVNTDALDRDANGDPLIPTDPGRQFFRTIIETGEGDAGAPIELASLPADVLQRGRDWLEASRGVEDGWGPDAEIAPCVHPIYDLAVNEGKTPAMLEFKVQRMAQPVRPGPFPSHNDECRDMDLGYFMVSLHDGEAPVAGASPTGLTPVEQLQCRAQNRHLKIFSFGGTFFTAEDASGKVVASLGQDPFRVDPSLASLLTEDRTWQGNDDTGEDTRPLLPAVRPAFYTGYAEFKTDYLTNPVYQKIRARVALRAHAEWNVERGQTPGIITLSPGQTLTVFPERTVRAFQWDSEDVRPAAHVAIQRTGGVLLTADAPGEGVLIVFSENGQESVAVKVLSAAGSPRAGRAFVPGWQPWSTTVIPGGYDETPQYNQLKRPQWCPYVGCGPNAWAMLAGWYDRHGVPAAFGNLVAVDAPPNTSDAAKNSTYLVPEFNKLHDFCDVICNPFSDEGATLPGDQAEGILDYTSVPRVLQFLKISYSMRWAGLFSELDEGAPDCRAGILAGRPCVVGLGHYTHYALAYAYRVRSFKITENGPPLFYARELACNMGWGPGQKAWKGYYGTFFSSNVRMWKGPAAP